MGQGKRVTWTYIHYQTENRQLVGSSRIAQRVQLGGL